MTTKYIDQFPKPMLDDLVAGRWLPILGAGFSRNAVLPPSKEMPLWGDLGKMLAKDLGDYLPTSPLDAISAFEHELGRARLIERLADLLMVNEARPGPVHRSFCQLQFDLVCTTNLEFLLEMQYALVPRPCTPLIEEQQLAIRIEAPAVGLLKLHGDLHHPTRLIVSEGDYDLFLTRYPLLATFVANLLITRTAVLIGYSLDDPDFRQLWQVVGERLGSERRSAYVLTAGASASDVARYARRGIKVINLAGRRSSYAKVLIEAFDELYAYWGENVIRASYVKEEQPLRELSLPAEAPTRICFFAIPFSLNSFYRERVFPIAREFGFVPMAADDVVSPGDAVYAKLDVLMRRAQLFVVDASNQNTLAEFRLVRRLATPLQILVVAPKGGGLPAEIANFETVIRPDVAEADPQEFLFRLTRWFSAAAERSGPSQAAEPQRLFGAREYRAAVISAITLLESTLRKSLDLPEKPSGRITTFRSLLEVAQQRGLLGNTKVNTVLGWFRIRSEVVHTGRAVSREAAQEIVEGVDRIAAALRQ